MRTCKALMGAAMGMTVILALVTVSPVLAGDDVIHKGVDVWMTVAGFAKTSFAKEPIPAGFFCADSQPFTGAVVFKGVPLAMTPANRLGRIDTVVRRLDDSAFDAKGEATTRIQLMALSLASTKPIETSCGKYDVAVSLAGEQPTTTMRIFKTDALGGTYTAPLALNVKAVFTPVGGDRSGRRELTRRIDLGPATHSVWTYLPSPRYQGRVRIDTDGDRRPDTELPAASNFLAGVSPAVLKGQPKAIPLAAQDVAPTCPSGQCLYRSCHCTALEDNPTYDQSSTGCADDHLHCVWVCVPNGTPGALCTSTYQIDPNGIN
jgi:hypothetical protein